MNKKTDLTIAQKILLVVWLVAVLISFVKDIIEFYAVLDNGFYSVAFNDGLKQLVVSCFYTYISYVLFKLLYHQQGKFINLLSTEGIKQISKLLTTLVGLLVTKIVFSFIIVKYVLPKAADASIGESLGYEIGSKLFRLQPHKDLIIAIAIVWVFLLVLEHAQKLKQEQEFTI
ncbi:hypothetical protein [Pedobacter sp. Hv1]|uniref:hypothetical protein n=1 Tax=Pedobacter sp. Hv1 TaxID=1740090 RepID=UPI000A9A036F|nr:hypothetical protein [Pedobacter sp. Hv1]